MFRLTTRLSQQQQLHQTINQIKLLSNKSILQLQFSNDTCSQLSAELLRVYSPSAQNQRIISGKKFVTITGIEKVGNYAVRISFSDKHETGIYTFQYLYEMSVKKYTFMKQYINKLKNLKKSRYPSSLSQQKVTLDNNRLSDKGKEEK
jgi:DUF971 family protein